jgi:glutamate-1-semialdehyde 2,1-aminomutase
MPALRSEELFQRALQVSPGGVHSPVRSFKGMDRPPVFFASARGALLESVEGRSYIDFCQSFGPLILGHRDPEVQEAVQRMIGTAWTFGACEPYSLELAEWITARIPWCQKLRFVSSGTEAVMSALRVARAATGRPKILKFDGCYHGHSDGLLVRAGSGLAGEASSSSAGVPEAMAALTLVCPLDDEAALEAAFASHGPELAAAIIEPLPANYGLLKQRPEFLRRLQALCRRHGSLLVFDEVISGFRVGLQGMAGKLGMQPDLVTYGKILGGGFPVGCYGGRRELMDQVAPAGPVYQAGTLSASPVGMAAGLATLKKMEALDGWAELERRGSAFAARLALGLKPSGLRVERLGSLFWLHGAAPAPIRAISAIPAGQAERFKKLFLRCLDQGLYLAPNAFEVGFISLAHSPELLAQSAGIIVEAARD